MQFGTLKIQNFLSIGQAEVNLSNRGLVLIEGANVDDPAAKSNGSGKSSLVDALSWVLYGQTARGVKNDDVINRHVKKNCLVEVEVIDGADRYVICRTRKHSEKGTALYVTKKGEEDVDMTKGTMAETQAVVEEIIGCPYAVFVSAIYAGQDAMPDLPAMTDKQLKTLIESVIGAERLNAAYEVVKKEFLDAEAYAMRFETNLLTLEEKLKTNEDYENNVSLMSIAWEGQKVTRECEVDRKIAQLRAQKEEHQKVLENTSAEEKRLRAQLAAVEEKLSEREKQIQALEPLRDQVAAKEREIASSNARFESARTTAQTDVQSVKTINSKIGTKCSECGKIYTEEDLDEAKTLAAQKAKASLERAQQYKAELSKLMDEKDVLLDMLKEKKSEIPEPFALKKEQRDLFEALSNLSRGTAAIDFDETIAQLEKQKKSIAEEENQYLPMLANLAKEKKALKMEIAKAKSDMADAVQNRDVLEALKDVFGPAGVRAHILDTITPLLNDRTARYLDFLSDGKLSAVWTTLTTTKKGEIKEKFNIEVKNAIGGARFESLSGGEKRKVRVACCMALQEVVASRATKPISLFVADEVDHALDEAGVERLIALLNEKAMTCGTLLVISHNPLRNWIDNTITVKKENGISTIVE